MQSLLPGMKVNTKIIKVRNHLTFFFIHVNGFNWCQILLINALTVITNRAANLVLKFHTASFLKLYKATSMRSIVTLTVSFFTLQAFDHGVHKLVVRPGVQRLSTSLW